jgi:hypothetical protein
MKIFHSCKLRFTKTKNPFVSQLTNCVQVNTSIKAELFPTLVVTNYTKSGTMHDPVLAKENGPLQIVHSS